MKKTTTFFSNRFVRKSGILCMGIFAFATANLFGQTTFNYTGSLQTYTVPSGVTSIRIDASGAQGGSVSTTCAATGGLGAGMAGDFAVTPGEVLSIMVGQQGLTNGSDAGGGGGTFVVRTGNVCLVAAGGGGGATNNITACGTNRDGMNATITTSGTASANGIVAGGTGGNGGGASTGSGGGGGGFLTDGVAGTGLANNNGKSYLNGGAGGTGNNNDFGGYGGGGAGWFTGGNGGGGGGYSGGGTSGSQPFSGGGGGGSFNAGTNQTNTAGFQTGNGRVIITVLYSASISQTQQIQCFGQSNASLLATPAGGSGPFTYAWAPTGGTSATASGLGAGTYTVTITDATMATATQTFTVTQPTALSVTTSQTNLTCNGAGNGTAMVMPSGGTPGYTYAWSSGSNAALEMGLGAGNYSCITTDANGCTITQTILITEPSALAATTSQINVPCNGSASGNATVSVSGGTPGYSYSWSPSGGNGAMSSGLTAGTYSCTITDANGCVLTETFNITEPFALTAMSSSTDVACNGGNTGTGTAIVNGGTSPYMYSWSPSGGTAAMAMGLTAGSYTCNVVDANGCTSFVSILITEPTVLTSFATATSILCNGGMSTITVTASGGVAPYSGDGTYTVIAGTYNTLVTDANGCTTLTPSITITEPTAIVAPVVTSNGPTTCGGSNGAIDITVNGGTPGYTFLWNTTATTEDLSGITAGTYSNIITDANGCVLFASFTISDPTPPTVTMTLPTTTVCADDGNVTLSGGSPAGGVYSGPGVTAGIFDPSTSVLGANTITYTYTNPNTLCSASATSVITVNACTGVQSQVSNESNFLVIPNPNNGTFQLQLNTTGIADVLIYDNMGKLVSAQKIQPNVQQEVTISTSGIYLISVITADGQRSSQRVVVSK